MHVACPVHTLAPSTLRRACKRPGGRGRGRGGSRPHRARVWRILAPPVLPAPSGLASRSPASLSALYGGSFQACSRNSDTAPVSSRSASGFPLVPSLGPAKLGPSNQAALRVTCGAFVVARIFGRTGRAPFCVAGVRRSPAAAGCCAATRRAPVGGAAGAATSPSWASPALDGCGQSSAVAGCLPERRGGCEVVVENPQAAARCACLPAAPQR